MGNRFHQTKSELEKKPLQILVYRILPLNKCDPLRVPATHFGYILQREWLPNGCQIRKGSEL